MKKFLLATVALSALAGSALAADLPYRRAAPAPMPAFVAVPVFTWSGMYVGVNAGYGFGGEGNTTTSPLNAAASSFINSGISAGGAKLEREGFVGGGQIGYNYQVGALVLGVETDFQYTDLSKTATANLPGGNFSSYRTSMDYLGTVRGRVGYAMDRWMIYATGGLAYGDVYNRHYDGNAGGILFAGSKSETKAGYAVGAGVEYAMPAFNWGGSAATVKVEYMYYDLGKQGVTSVSAGGTPFFHNRFENDGHIVRAGLNWKFGGF